ncbi:glycosyltransferase family 4 protein [Roseospirillum parvum]|uniref:Glycosyltransferase involved in cell wall bisynthesis n=1 Tax=Roseospirillum parvum TaxID=83401 RepID=A0A1G8BMP1_9PROT|nr:glycosyltransferase family 4 protein [Roseospirillum parvum]SDH34354.1 Glycosyltransferase involved in cell wall bisynthesis [Roseospirillum parvum]
MSRPALPDGLSDGLSDLGIAWTAGLPSGWGTYGLNLALEARLAGVRPHLFFLPDSLPLDPARRFVLEPALRDHVRLRHLLDSHGGGAFPYPVLHALGDRLSFPPETRHLNGRPDIGVVFLEHTDIPPENLETAAGLARVITGSTFNHRALAEAGLTNLAFCPQGIDPALFHPAPRRGLFAGRFAVFAGGKLEYRKGQDITLAAFKTFARRHPEALLVTAWHNRWPASLASIANAPHSQGQPRHRPDGSLDIAGWAADNGLDPAQVLDLGELDHRLTAPILRECDAALLPSRCEGGTNLVAMEAMACGLPVILSANTGHLDLIGPERCLSLDSQIDLGQISGTPGLAGWGDSLPDEATAALENLHADPDLRHRLGTTAARFMAGWTWGAQIRRLLDALAGV